MHPRQLYKGHVILLEGLRKGTLSLEIRVNYDFEHAPINVGASFSILVLVMATLKIEMGTETF